jgi:hypothetical protein
MLSINEFISLVTKFMLMVDKKIKVEFDDQADDDMPTVIVTFPSREKYIIGCDHNAKAMDRYLMRPKCFFACRGETRHSNSYYEPDDFEWIDIAVNVDCVPAICVKVALDEYKQRFDDFNEKMFDIVDYFNEEIDGE